MKSKNMKRVLPVALAVSILATGCGGDQPKDKKEAKANQVQVEDKREAGQEASKDTYKSPNGNTMVTTLFQNPKTLDIQKTNADYFIPLQIYNRLVEAKPDGKGGVEIVPSLAESWELSEDGKVYTFHLAKGVKFHNGEEFKADDVLFTIDKMMNPEEATINSWIFEPIEGAMERLEGQADTVSGVKVLDDYTVEISLKEQYAPFLAKLTDAPASIYNRKAVEEGKDKFGFESEYTVGTGFMKFQDWKQDQEINIVRNDDYFKGPINIDGLRYLINIDSSTARMMFENGELDLITIDSKASYDSYTQSDFWKDQVFINDRPGVTYVSFNEECEPIKDERVRKAIQKAINREVINQNFFNGTGTIINGCIPPMIPGYKEDLPSIDFNPEEAKKLLEEAGYKDGLELVLLQNGASDFTHPINETIQAMLAEVGIKLEIKNVDKGAYWDMMGSKTDDFAMSVGPMTAGAPDPSAFFSNYKIAGDDRDKFDQKRLDLSDAIEEADLIVDPDERVAKFQELELAVAQDQALYLPLVSSKGEWVISPRLEDFQLSWQGWVTGVTEKVKINPDYNK